jgi:hypothetical protein
MTLQAADLDQSSPEYVFTMPLQSNQETVAMLAAMLVNATLLVHQGRALRKKWLPVKVDELVFGVSKAARMCGLITGCTKTELAADKKLLKEAADAAALLLEEKLFSAVR